MAEIPRGDRVTHESGRCGSRPVVPTYDDRMVGDGDGVYYFLGNVTSHIVHALPLLSAVGGEVVVLSESARDRLAAYDVPVRVCDDLPRRWRRTGPRFTRTDQYLHVPRAARRTRAFLESEARVVLFYELFDLTHLRLRTARTVFLSHGNPIKPYFSGRDRFTLLRRYDHVAGLGPYNRDLMVASGLEPDRVAELGIARTDQVVARRGARSISPEIAELVGPTEGRRVFAYLPTFWGASSVQSLGLDIVRDMPESDVLLVRLHPQTPATLVDRYRAIAARKDRVHLLLDDRPGRGLLDVMAAADAVIGELSSVMLEALLLDKPLVFALDDATDALLRGGHPIGDVVARAPSIRSGGDLRDALDRALADGYDQDLWRDVTNRTFFHADGTSVRHLESFVRSLTTR